MNPSESLPLEEVKPAEAGEDPEVSFEEDAVWSRAKRLSTEGADFVTFSDLLRARNDLVELGVPEDEL